MPTILYDCRKCSKEERPNLFYPIQDPTTGNVFDCNPNLVWMYNRETMNQKIKEGRIIFPKSPSQRPYLKLFWNDLKSQYKPVSSFVSNKEDFSFAFTAEGAREVAEIMGGKLIQYSKPTINIQKLISVTTKDTDVVLDFFAGSGTTAQAVLNQNREDMGSRKFILVQLPERIDHESDIYKMGYKTIADITKERVRRVIKKLNEDDDGKLPLEDQKKQNRGFKVFKLQSSNFKQWNPQRPENMEALGKQLELHINHIEKEATEEEILYELLLKAGFQLTTKTEKLTLAGKTVYAIEGGTLLICLDKQLTTEVIKAIAEKKPYQVIMLDEGFKDNDQLKTNAAYILKSKGVEKFQTV